MLLVTLISYISGLSLSIHQKHVDTILPLNSACKAFLALSRAYLGMLMISYFLSQYAFSICGSSNHVGDMFHPLIFIFSIF